MLALSNANISSCYYCTIVSDYNSQFHFITTYNNVYYIHIVNHQEASHETTYHRKLMGLFPEIVSRMADQHAHPPALVSEEVKRMGTLSRPYDSKSLRMFSTMRIVRLFSFWFSSLSYFVRIITYFTFSGRDFNREKHWKSASNTPCRESIKWNNARRVTRSVVYFWSKSTQFSFFVRSTSAYPTPGKSTK